ncbi:ganglioside GM2 activator [Heteronotia binoei]|uniref:ganglioside GM2 activator n=1 Tax=Heteronotia binoei TaxID=13085 RepID=UPI00292CF140|nr:ganglioside GM2 activator [Heteronotia binoei]
MQALFLTLTLAALQLWPAVLGGPQHQRFVQSNGWPFRLSRVYSFAWQNCGPSDPAWIKSLNIIPDPICIPGDMTVCASATTTVAIEAPLKGVIVLEKKMGDMWLKIPCMDNIGSCTYNNLCAMLDELIPPGQLCPEPLQSYGIPCHCPFKAGTYNLPPSVIYIPNLDLPSFLTNGDYRIKIVLSMGDQELGCAKISFSLHAGSRWFWW